MSDKIIHAVLEGLDQSQSKGGLIIRKKPATTEVENSDGGFKLPSGPSLLGLDKLAVVKEQEKKAREAEIARKRQLEAEEEAESERGEKFVRKSEKRERERQLREPRVETPSYTGGVSQEAVRRDEERRRREDRGLKAEKKRERDDDYYQRE